MSSNVEDIQRAKSRKVVFDDDYNGLMTLYLMIFTSIRMLRRNKSGSRQIPTPRTANWTAAKDKCLIDIMRCRFEAGDWVNRSFTKRGWKLIVDEFCKEEDNIMTSQQIINRWKNLKKNYQAFHYLRNKSGWDWDCHSHSPIAPTEDAWLELDDHFRKFRGKTFPLYDDMECMVGRDMGGSAVGTQIPVEVENENAYTPSGDDSPYSDMGNMTPTMTTPNLGSKRATNIESHSSKRCRGGGDGLGRFFAELKEMLSQHISIQKKTSNRDYERADIAHCKELIRKLCPQLQGMEYVRILDMLGDPIFRDVLCTIAEEGAVVFVDWLYHKLKG